MKNKIKSISTLPNMTHQDTEPIEQTINFHDCQIVRAFKENSNLIVVMKMDTHWFPGKDYAKFCFSKPWIEDKFLELVEKDVDGILQFFIIKNFENYFHVIVKFQSDNYSDFMTKQYDFERIDSIYN